MSENPKKPVVMHLPMGDETIDRIVKHRLGRGMTRRWRWDLNDSGLASLVTDLPKEAAEAVTAARQQVFDLERQAVVSLLTDIETVGRLISEEMDEQ